MSNRHENRLRMRVAVGAFAVVALLAAGVFAVIFVGRDASSPQNLASSSRRSEVAPADTQRLLIAPQSIGVVGMADASPSDAPWLRSIFEQGTDGSFASRSPSLPSDLAVRTVKPTPDGGLAIFGSQDLQPGRPRVDGPYVEGLAFPLLIFSGDGSLKVQRDLRVVGEDVALLGVTPTAAVLERGTPTEPGAESRVVLHDFASGAEKSLATTRLWANQGDVATDRLAFAGQCEARGLNLATGEEASFKLQGCSQVFGVKVSSDARTVAVVYGSQKQGAASDLRLATFDAATGAAVSEAALGQTMPFGKTEQVCGSNCPKDTPVDYGGMAWSDAGTLSVGLIEHPASGDPREVSLPDSIRVEQEAVTR
jgi:hypothetical protein